MQAKALKYIDDQFAATGFAAIDSGIAYMLRPDLWATRFNCSSDFTTGAGVVRSLATNRGACLFEAVFADLDHRVLVLARSAHDLAQRIEWITGLRVTAIALNDDVASVPSQPAPPKKVDGEEIPSYPCRKRDEMLAKAGLKDAVFDHSTKFPPPRAGL